MHNVKVNMVHAESPEASPSFDDSSWADVGIPHTWNDADTFVNGESGAILFKDMCRPP